MNAERIIDGNYLIDEYGHITRATPARGTVVGKAIQPHLDTKGYYRVRLAGYNGAATYKVHRLVASAFLPNPENMEQVNHKDGNKTNNHVSNLEWCTGRFNMQHAAKAGLIKGVYKGRKGKDHNRSIPFKGRNRLTGEERIFHGTYEAERETGVNIGSIWRVRKGIYKHAKNWEFEKY